MTAATADEVWALLREVVEMQKETTRRFQDTDRKFQDTEQLLRAQSQDTDRKFQDTDRKFQDTDRKFQDTDRKFQDTDRKFQDTDRKFQETEQFLKAQAQAADRRMKRLDEQLGKLGNRLGEFVEGLVRPAVVSLFRARGIEVHEVYADVEVERGEEGLQIDLLVVDDTEAILVEVKSKLTQADVDEHLDRLGKFKRLLPRYAGARALGAVAAMVIPREVGRYAYRQGLFVLAQSGDGVVILNDAKFQPRAW